MTVRFLLKEQSALIAQFFEQNFSDGWTENMLNSAFDGERFFAIGCFDGEILIGVVCLSLSFDTADIEDIVTEKSRRKEGVASLLLSKAEDFIKSQKKQKIFLEVRSSNLPAITLYKKFKYKQISQRNNYYFDGENALVMAKEIKY